MTTTAALCQPMLATLGVSTLAAYLAMCSGGIIMSHANNSGFWLTCSMTQLNFKQGIRSVGMVTLVTGLACCALRHYLIPQIHSMTFYLILDIRRSQLWQRFSLPRPCIPSDLSC